jgi:hypothetical protein
LTFLEFKEEESFFAVPLKMNTTIWWCYPNFVEGECVWLIEPDPKKVTKE